MTNAAFFSLAAAIDIDIPQQVADSTYLILSVIPNYQSPSFEKEQIVMTNMPTIKKAWAYVSRNDRKSSRVRFRNGTRALQSLIDLAFKPLVDGSNSLLKWIENYVGRYFSAVLQGITIFENERNPSDGSHQLGRPAYHRPASCGPSDGGTTYESNHLDCTGTEGEEYIRRRNNTWNCFIERLIYQSLYLKVVQIADQDFGHRYHLRHVRQEVFESCYPLIHVDVSEDIKFDWQGNVPISITIKYTVRREASGPFIHVIERYGREFRGGVYKSEVICQRSEIDMRGGRTRELRRCHKTQTYWSDGGSPWVCNVLESPRLIGGTHTKTGDAYPDLRLDPWMSYRPNINKSTFSISEMNEMAKRCRNMLHILPQDIPGAL